jgi:hypothetical protein
MSNWSVYIINRRRWEKAICQNINKGVFVGHTDSPSLIKTVIFLLEQFYKSTQKAAVETILDNLWLRCPTKRVATPAELAVRKYIKTRFRIYSRASDTFGLALAQRLANSTR